MSKTFTDKTAAADKSIGFDYQYYYFLDTVLNLKAGESAGFEVKDDVHTELDADRQILVQLKHTIKTNVDGQPIALSDYSSDLWKTISNWAQIIADPLADRGGVAAQINFLKKTKFLLVTNKSNSNGNTFLEAITNYRNSSIYEPAVRKILSELQNTTKNKTIKTQISTVLSLNKKCTELFFSQIEFDLNENDIFGRIKNSILTKIISANRVDGVFQRLDSAIRTDNFLTTKSGMPIIISHSQFNDKYSKLFTDTREEKLLRYDLTPKLPEALEGQLFIKQLLDIDDFKIDDTDLILRYTTCKFALMDHLEKWKLEGLLTAREIQELHDAATTEWHNRFRTAYRFIETLSNAKQKKAALSLIDELRKLNLKIDEQQMDVNFTNGEYYYLSDLPAIGWHHEWEKKFK